MFAYPPRFTQKSKQPHTVMKPSKITQTLKSERSTFRSASLLTVILWPIAQGADLTVTDGSSSAVGANISLSLLLTNTATGNLPDTTKGTAPAPYNVPENAVPLAVNTPGLVTAGGTIHTSASSTVDGLPGPRTTSASARVANLSLNIVNSGVISLNVPNANGASATTTISGEGGSFTSNTSVALDGLTISVLGLPIDLSAINLSNVPPNTGLNTVAGLGIILNETSTAGTAAGGYTTTTNAIRIRLTGFQGLNGDIIIGQAKAAQGSDPDNDGTFSGTDGDADGDGIPSAVEIANARAGTGGDTDGDGTPDHLDLDSDNDGINDVIEAGGKDVNGNGIQDASGDANPDDDGDGIVDSVDPDDNIQGGGKGTALTVPDTDGDLTKNYLDLDADNDGLSDLFESGQAPAGDVSGVLPSSDTDGDGISNGVDGLAGFGDAPPVPSTPLTDSDNDGIPNAFETDSNNDGTPDINGTAFASLDANLDGRIDNNADTDHDGIADVADYMVGQFGGLANPSGDGDGDGISNQDEGLGLVDTDGDGVPDIADGDSDSDGIPDLFEGGNDFDGDGVSNARDLDSDGDGINDVIEAGGKDTNGDGRQDPSGDANPDEDGDGMVDSVDTNDLVNGGGFGTPLPRPDSDGDGSPDFLDLDSDNDTISDLVESGVGAVDSNNDGISDGVDPDRDGLAGSSDGLPAAFGDSGGSTPIDTDGDGIPNYLDPDSDGNGILDIDTVGNGGLDTDNDGKIDNNNLADADNDGIPDVVDDNDNLAGGLSFDLLTYAAWVAAQFTAPDNTNPAVSGPNADPDHDGYTNAVEFAAGSDPENPASKPTITTTTTTNGGVTTVGTSLVRNPNAYAFVFAEASRNLMAWSAAPDILTVNVNNPGMMNAQVSSVLGDENSDKGFIRFRVVIP